MAFDVVLRCVLCVFSRVDVMSMCEMRMMRCCFVVSILVMPGGFAVMTRSVLVMFRCLVVMMCCFVRHREILSSVLSAPQDYEKSKRAGGYKNANSM